MQSLRRCKIARKNHSLRANVKSIIALNGNFSSNKCCFFAKRKQWFKSQMNTVSWNCYVKVSTTRRTIFFHFFFAFCESQTKGKMVNICIENYRFRFALDFFLFLANVSCIRSSDWTTKSMFILEWIFRLWSMHAHDQQNDFAARIK